MKFTRENYEHFMIDYLEGNLNSQDMAEFGSFLNLNPDINDSLTSFNEFSLHPTDATFQDKASLKKEYLDLLDNIPEEELNCIAYLENDLGIDKAGAFIKMTSEKPEYLSLLYKYKNTILTPLAIQYPNKNLLKKAVPFYFRKVIWIPSAAAAIIFILFIVRILFIAPSSSEFGSPQISQSQQENQYQTLPKGSKSENLASDKSRTVPIEKDNSSKTAEPSAYQSINKILASNNLDEDNHPEVSDRNLMTNAIPLLEGKSETIQAKKFDNYKLHPPIIYIPRELSPQVLSAFEAYTIEDFRVKLVKSTDPRPTTTPLLVALADAGIKGANKISGGNMELNTASNKQGKLTAFVFNSRGLKIASSVKKKKL